MILRATKNEVAQLHALEIACFAEAWSGKSLAQGLENPDYLTLLERDQCGDSPGEPLCYLIGWQIGADVELARIGVAPGARGQGHAGRMLDAALGIWRASGAQNVWLEVRESNGVARLLYQGRGFAPVGKRPDYYADGEAALILRLVLARSSEFIPWPRQNLQH